MRRPYKNSIGFGKRASSMQPSVSLLPPLITTNSITVEPMLRYSGYNATISAWPHWGYGGDLSIVGSGNDVIPNQGSPLSGSAYDDSVKFDDGKTFEAADATVGAITTEDIWIDVLFKTSTSTGTEFLIAKQDGGNTTPGVWSIYRVNKTLVFNICDGASTALIGSNNLTLNAWHFLSFGINRNENSTNGWLAMINGSTVKVRNPYPSRTSLDDGSSKFRIGARSDNGYPTNDTVAYLVVYKQADWFRAGADGATDMLAIHQNRWNKIKWT